MKINQPQYEATSTDDANLLELPLEQLLISSGGDAFFALHWDGKAWLWEFHDEQGFKRAKSSILFLDIKDAIAHVRETQKRIGVISTPILRVV